VEAATKEVDAAARELATTTRRVDEIRAGLVDEALVLGATERLRSLTGSTAPPDELTEPARAAVADISGKVEELSGLERDWGPAAAAGARITEIRSALAAAQAASHGPMEEGQPFQKTAHRKQAQTSSFDKRATSLLWLSWAGVSVCMMDTVHCVTVV
jgi:hypothetical protein